jgi:hypothetical protein
VFRRVALVFALVSVAVWFYVFDEWWSLVPALLLAPPVGIAFSFLPSLLVGTVRPLLSGFATTWLFILGGLALIAYALVACEGTTRALLSLCGAGLVAGGLGLFLLRLDAMRAATASQRDRD